MMRMNNERKSESGMIIMASTMGIFIILSLFAFYLARFSITESRTGGYYMTDIKARNLAMTGIEHAIQSYKSSRSITNNISGNFNNGSYSVSFDTQNNEAGTALPHSHFITVKSTATINDVERNLRLIISSMPEAFLFSFYGNNYNNSTFNEPNGTISGDMFYNGNVQSNSGTNSGVTYTSTGIGGTLLSSPPSFPALDITQYEALLTSAASASSAYNNYALDFDGSNDWVQIGNSGDINTGSNHTQKTIEAWFKVDDKNITSRKQTIYEQGGTVRGLNIYVYGGNLYVGGWNEPNGESDWDPGTWLSTSSIQSNTWHHVALTLNGGNSVTNNAFKGYLDGTQFGSGQGSKLWNHPGGIGIARNADTKFHTGDYSSARYFGGTIDEVRLWNVERTASQIAAKKDTVLAGNESGLTAYYNFQENTGTTANDTQTQSNNDGSIKNGASWTDGPTLSKMGSTALTNTTINLSSYANNQLLANNELTLSGSTVNGPGYIVVNGNLNISSNTTINGNIFLICSGNLTISNSQIGTGLGAAVVIYSKGVADYNNSTVYGLIISKGNGLELDGSTVYGAILNYSSSFSLVGDSDITGSVISNSSVDFQGNDASITRGNIPTFLGLNIGLDPIVVPGSYLEY